MSPQPMFRFCLYVADDSPNGALAIENLTAICLQHLPGRHVIEVVDIFREPERALADAIVITPTLVRLEPLPVCRITGTLNPTLAVLQALGLENPAAA